VFDMLQWKIGDVTITRVVEMEVPVPYHPKRPLIAAATPDALQAMPWLYPAFVTPEGHLLTSIHALLVEAPGLRLVVDTCIGNDKPRRMTGRLPLQTSFLRSMTDAGWPCESVSAVICTHLHVDHVGWNTRLENGRWVPTFPRARYLIGREEYAHWQSESGEETQQIVADSVKPIFDAGLVDLVEMDHRVSPEISLLPTPGHTPGHVSVVIESRGERALITGDVLHHPCQCGDPSWSTSFDSSVTAAQAARIKLLDSLADQPTLMIGTHFASPCAGRVRRDGKAYRLEV
jgi:glyoxylase-like metal-dependent hydrolase (beta-lactamase superfamily II)